MVSQSFKGVARGACLILHWVCSYPGPPMWWSPMNALAAAADVGGFCGGLLEGPFDSSQRFRNRPRHGLLLRVVSPNAEQETGPARSTTPNAG